MRMTGNLRWRSQRRWGREELVLQVEWDGTEIIWNGYFADSETRHYWSDAKSEDMRFVNLKEPLATPSQDG
jgi:hypothetical protein